MGSSNDDEAGVLPPDQHIDEPKDTQRGIDAKIFGCFNDKSPDAMREMLSDFLRATLLTDYEKYFEKGMYLAQHPNAFSGERSDGLELNEDEQRYLRYDKEPEVNGTYHFRKIGFRKWYQPFNLYKLVTLCALGAVVQGWDQLAVNSAQIYFAKAFDIVPLPPPEDERISTDPWNPHNPEIFGLVNSAPYLGCVASCWLTPKLNESYGRRGTIFLTAIFSAAFALAQAFANTWQTLFVFRFLLGFGIGPKSATVPIYASEAAPPNIRGSLVMLWQVFTAFGIMCGSLSGLAFQNVRAMNQTQCLTSTDLSTKLGLNCSLGWRLMLASPCLAPTILAMYIYTQPESPRWSIKQGHRLRHRQPNNAASYYQAAFFALKKLRHTTLQAARDMFAIYFLLEEEAKEMDAAKDDKIRGWYRKGVLELFMLRQNRRSLAASLVCMFAQQFCGVNVIIYYSNFILTASGIYSSSSLTSPTRSSSLFTLGFGMINFFFAFPALVLIDVFGRRSLLLATIPFLALSQLFLVIATAAGNFGPSTTAPGFRQKALTITGMYLFGIFYSPGLGPVPFVYAAESLPFYVRELGMGVVVSINWLFNWQVAFTFTRFFNSFKAYGAFLWYCAWNVIIWFMVYYLVPETRQMSLEQLDRVFRKSNRDYWRLCNQHARYFIRRHIFRDRSVKKPPNPADLPTLESDSNYKAGMETGGVLGEMGSASSDTQVSRSEGIKQD